MAMRFSPINFLFWIFHMSGPSWSSRLLSAPKSSNYNSCKNFMPWAICVALHVHVHVNVSLIYEVQHMYLQVKYMSMKHFKFQAGLTCMLHIQDTAYTHIHV